MIKIINSKFSINQVLNLLNLYFLKKPTFNIFIKIDKQLSKNTKALYFPYSNKLCTILCILEQPILNQIYIENILYLLYKLNVYFINTDNFLIYLIQLKQIRNLLKFQLYFIATKNLLQINHFILQNISSSNLVLINFINIHNFYKFLILVPLVNNYIQINITDLFMNKKNLKYFLQLHKNYFLQKQFIFKNLMFLINYIFYKELLIKEFYISLNWIKFSIRKFIY